MAEETPAAANASIQIADTAVRLLAAFQLLLMFVTLAIWYNSGPFPVIPLLNPSRFPLPPLTTCSTVLALACLVIALSGGFRRLAIAKQARIVSRWTLIAFTAGIVATVANQQCLQAWHVFFLWALSASLFLKPERRLIAIRHLFACVYVCSGLSRISNTPASSATGMILAQLVVWLPDAVRPNQDQFTLICHAAAFFEIALGLLLLVPGRLQRIGLSAACCLHGTLLLALGPLGLGHHAGVLIWNLCLLFLLPLTFRLPVERLSKHTMSGNGKSQTSATPGIRLSADALWFLLLWTISLAGLAGITDNWPSWQLYSPRPEQWQLWIDRRSATHLSPPFVTSPILATVDQFIPVRLDQASLVHTGTPLYPEDRFQLALIESVLQQLPPDARFEVRIDQPNRFPWWTRTLRTIQTREELAREHQQFLFNSYPAQ